MCVRERESEREREREEREKIISHIPLFYLSLKTHNQQQFGYAHGRAALARVLRAAALEDPKVGYCQGMAFVAGVLLMFLPEELSFRVLTERLLREQEVISVDGDEEEVEEGGEKEERKEKKEEEKEESGGRDEKEEGGGEKEPRPPRIGGAGGAGLRTLYEPGLSGLKSLLAQYEWLLERIAPEVSARLSVRFFLLFYFFDFFFRLFFRQPNKERKTQHGAHSSLSSSSFPPTHSFAAART